MAFHGAAYGQNSHPADSSSKRHSVRKRTSGDRIVLTAKEIGEMNVQSIPELLNRLPGITAGETYAKIQGATNVRVLLDGRPINSSSSGYSGIKWNMVAVRDIEKIEILMGGGAAAVGDGTSGGAILLTSRKNNGVHGHIDASGGNYGMQDLTFRFGQLTGIVTMGASGSYACTDGYRVNNDKTKNGRVPVSVFVAMTIDPSGYRLIMPPTTGAIPGNRSGPHRMHGHFPKILIVRFQEGRVR